VEAARHGDREAFGRLYEAHAPLVHGILFARLPSGLVDDLVQEVFLIALRRLSQLRDAACFGPWVAAIARNRARDVHRRGVREEALPELPAPDGPSAEALAAVAALRSLPEAYSETLALRLVEGLTGPEIAERTGLTPGSVRVNLHRGMKLLRARLAGRPSR